MKSKKVLSVFISFIMLVLVCCSPFVAFASFFVSEGDVVSCPGNTRTYIDKDKYNYAWLDSVIARDSSTSVTPLTIHPVCDYPYSHTCKDFVEECNNYMLLFDASDTAVQNSVIEILRTIYYTLVASGKITDSSADMRAYNERCGIVYPYAESQLTDVYTVIAYACLKNDICKLITNEDVTITRGTTIEGAVVKLLSVICDMTISSNVDTIPAFSYLFTEKYVIEDSSYPVSDEPSEEEVYYWVKLQAAQKAGYSVPATTRYEDLSPSQIDYVTHSYYASILTTRYDTPIDPMKLKAALCSSDPSAEVPRAVLMAMLDHVSIGYTESETTQELFAKTLKEGYFDLEDEFYTDVYNYTLYVPADCDKVWITAFPIAEQLMDGYIGNVSTYLNGTLVKNNSTNYVEVPNEAATFTIRTKYNGRDDSAIYSFTVIKTADSDSYNKAPSIDISDPIQTISNDISNIISNAVNTATSSASVTTGFTFESQLTTYVVDNTTTQSGGSMFETYPTDSNGEVLTTRDPLELSANTQATVSVLSNVAETVRENPAVVAAPVGIIAIGASAGFLFYYKRKDDTYYDVVDE